VAPALLASAVICAIGSVVGSIQPNYVLTKQLTIVNDPLVRSVHPSLQIVDLNASDRRDGICRPGHLMPGPVAGGVADTAQPASSRMRGGCWYGRDAQGGLKREQPGLEGGAEEGSGQFGQPLGAVSAQRLAGALREIRMSAVAGMIAT
jgi:hypothetical protein